MATVKNNQNVFDLALQEFGTLEELFTGVLVPNNIELDKELKPGQEVNLNTVGLGNETIKNAIKEQGLVFTNEEIPLDLPWILAEGIWNDAGIWKDEELWID